MKHRFYFSVITLLLFVITLLPGCTKENMSDSTVQGNRGGQVSTNPPSSLLSINHWFRNQDDTYLVFFPKFLESNGTVKKVLGLSISNSSGEDLQPFNEVPTNCTGGKIWYSTEGPNLEVFFIPTQGRSIPTQLFIKVYYL